MGKPDQDNEEVENRMRHTVSELVALPTLANVDGAELKIEDRDEQAGSGQRVWLSGTPGQWWVTVEKWNPDYDAVAPNDNHATWFGMGRWEQADEYEPED